ncbi:hypothetical protein [Microlunatus ginsengisoli]|uniref:Uncharacterized protein n=1 Tax=Microlunatus ginsengisoli TaxID=363863 RepID=A0ABP7AIE9_9ACTN
MTPAWVLILVACITLVGVLVSALVTNLVNVRNNKAVQARWDADRRALEDRWERDQKAAQTRWQTELVALEGRTARAEDADERQDRRAKALELYKLASERAVSDNPNVAQLGVDALRALLTSDLLDDDMKPLVIAALGSTYADERKSIEAAEQAGEDIVVVQLDLEATDGADVALAQEAAAHPADPPEEGSE